MRSQSRVTLTPLLTHFLLCFVLLLSAGCTNTLNRAIYREHPEAIQKFLAEGANVNEANDEGGTPLIYAAQYNDLALIKTLVERGAHVNAVDHRGNSALGYLVSGQRYKNDAVVFLLAHGADVNVANNEWRTPLHLAVMRSCRGDEVAQQIELVDTLLGAGANPNIETRAKELPLHLAAAAGQPDQILERLIRATKAPQQALTRSGYSALSEAARTGQHEAALYLVSHGFKPQELLPSPPPANGQWLIEIEPTLSIDARAQEAVGDYLTSRGDKANALVNYQKSATSYAAAVTECQHVVAAYAGALKDAKAGRKSRIFSTIALNALGAGVGAATGIGFVAVPKRVDNHIDDYEEALERDQAELAKLTHDQSDLSVKLAAAETALKLEGGGHTTTAQGTASASTAAKSAAP